MSKVRKVCKECGNDSVWVDANAVWNEETQQYELLDTFNDNSWCNTCEAEAEIIDEEIK